MDSRNFESSQNSDKENLAELEGWSEVHAEVYHEFDDILSEEQRHNLAVNKDDEKSPSQRSPLSSNIQRSPLSKSRNSTNNLPLNKTSPIKIPPRLKVPEHLSHSIPKDIGKTRKGFVDKNCSDKPIFEVEKSSNEEEGDLGSDIFENSSNKEPERATPEQSTRSREDRDSSEATKVSPSPPPPIILKARIPARAQLLANRFSSLKDPITNFNKLSNPQEPIPVPVPQPTETTDRESGPAAESQATAQESSETASSSEAAASSLEPKIFKVNSPPQNQQLLYRGYDSIANEELSRNYVFEKYGSLSPSKLPPHSGIDEEKFFKDAPWFSEYYFHKDIFEKSVPSFPIFLRKLDNVYGTEYLAFKYSLNVPSTARPLIIVNKCREGKSYVTIKGFEESNLVFKEKISSSNVIIGPLFPGHASQTPIGFVEIDITDLDAVVLRVGNFAGDSVFKMNVNPPCVNILGTVGNFFGKIFKVNNSKDKVGYVINGKHNVTPILRILLILAGIMTDKCSPILGLDKP